MPVTRSQKHSGVQLIGNRVSLNAPEPTHNKEHLRSDRLVLFNKFQSILDDDEQSHVRPLRISISDEIGAQIDTVDERLEAYHEKLPHLDPFKREDVRE